mmetsp:Transcript_88136/g.245338  ORF Transcript_88136/g.245338 Transcript_88136/m.245338 type:complete len:286 (-) Transcript_88136:98-955(-)
MNKKIRHRATDMRACLIFLFMALATAKAVVQRDPYELLGGMVCAFAGFMVLKEDKVVGGCVKSFLRGVDGFCGHGGYACVAPFLAANLFNGLFGIFTICEIGYIYAHQCTRKPARDARSGAEENATSAPRFLLVAGAARALGALGGDDIPPDGGASSQAHADREPLLSHAQCTTASVLFFIVLAQTIAHYACAAVTVTLMRSLQQYVLERAPGSPFAYMPHSPDLEMADDLAVRQALALSRQEVYGRGQPRQRQSAGSGDEDVDVQRAILNSQADAWPGQAHRLS